ncbi:MAG: hypothetical protein CM1200mP18_22180 [Gammaproteobacteria bacterium]|nr:MAG: hypothetical protein CM1200mP18_22180 [Gammaproteobacteria bacterium]
MVFPAAKVSLLGWDILESGADHFLTIEDDAIGPLMKRLAQGTSDDPRIVAGEAAVAGLAGCIAACADTDLRQNLDLNENSSVFGIWNRRRDRSHRLPPVGGFGCRRRS